MKKISVLCILLAITTCFAEITLTTEMDQKNCNFAQKKLDKSRDLFHADFGLDGYAGKNDKLPKSYECTNLYF